MKSDLYATKPFITYGRLFNKRITLSLYTSKYESSNTFFNYFHLNGWFQQNNSYLFNIRPEDQNYFKNYQFK